MKFYEGKLNAAGIKVAIILSKFNSFIGDKLLEGAINAYNQLGGNDADLSIYKVPGSFEIPGLARKLIDSKKFDSIICLGVIIRGQTPHFDYVAGNTSKAIMQLSSEGQIPIIFGIITADDLEQAIDRAGTKNGNKGYDAMVNAIEMASLYKIID